MKIRTWHTVGAVFTILAGSLLHFVYEWSGFSPVFAVFGSVNESVWEHLKLLFWPFIFTAVIGLWVYGKCLPGYFAAKALGLIAGMLIITAVFYTYCGIIGQNFAWVDILLFVLGTAAAYAVSYNYIKNPVKYTKIAGGRFQPGSEGCEGRQLCGPEGQGDLQPFHSGKRAEPGAASAGRLLLQSGEDGRGS